MKTKILYAILAIVLLTGCYTVEHLRTDNLSETIATTNANDIEIYSTDKVEKEYIIVGSVLSAMQFQSDPTASADLLKKQAAKLGADAIISFRIQFVYGNIGSIMTSGTAVKFVSQ